MHSVGPSVMPTSKYVFMMSAGAKIGGKSTGGHGNMGGCIDFGLVVEGKQSVFFSSKHG